MVKIAKTKLNLEQELNLREKVFLGVTMIASLILFSNVFIEPQSQKIRSLRLELNNTETQAESVKKLIDATQSQIAQQENLQPQDTKVSEKVRRMLERKVTDTTREINSVVDLLGGREVLKKAEMINTTIGIHHDEKNYTMVPIVVEMKGKYGALAAYFKAVEELDKPLIIRSFDVDNLKEAPGFLRSKIEIELYIVKH